MIFEAPLPEELRVFLKCLDDKNTSHAETL